MKKLSALTLALATMTVLVGLAMGQGKKESAERRPRVCSNCYVCSCHTGSAMCLCDSALVDVNSKARTISVRRKDGAIIVLDASQVTVTANLGQTVHVKYVDVRGRPIVQSLVAVHEGGKNEDALGDQYQRLIAKQAASLKLDTANARLHYFNGRLLSVTPVEFQPDKLAEGQIVAVLKTELSADKFKLPPGTYNLFVVKEGSNWRCYAESNGAVAPQPLAAIINTTRSNTFRSGAGSEAGDRKPEVAEQAGRFKITIHCNRALADCEITIEL